jgi:hypothetical protein
VTTDKYGYRITEALTLNPDIWVLMGSTNDTGQGVSTIQAATLALLQSIRSGGSTAPIVVLGVWSLNSTATITGNLNATTTVSNVSSFANLVVGQTITGTGIASGTTITALNSGASTLTLSQAATATSTGTTLTVGSTYVTESAVQAAVTQFADSKCWFVPITQDASGLPWITGTWNNGNQTTSTNASLYIGGDNTHPIDFGTQYLSNRIANAIRTQVLPNL